MAGSKPFTLPRPEKRPPFSLLPLADCMLQLLIFFMLSSSMAMYSLLDIRQGEGPGGGGGGEVVPGGTEAPGGAGPVVWTVDSGSILAGNGQRISHADLAQLARLTAEQDDVRVVLLVSPAASVQDLVRVLEALSASGIASVQVAGS